MITIVDYGVGNLRSVANMLRKVGAACQVSSDPQDILNTDRLILPGVGHFRYGMGRLLESGLIDSLNEVALVQKKPVLGICLGAQILGSGSEEAPGVRGLGWIDMHCKRIPDSQGCRVPHMGWSDVRPVRSNDLVESSEEPERYYFVHSYYMECKNKEDCIAETDYSFPYTCAVNRENIYGTQFHPEKSHRFGMELMKRFCSI